ncbi:MAG: glycerol acyltransferase [Sphingobacteriales bacterium 41-5]|nr:MAG: glycerol acyltransferase [Sphingobacteriales bacterium 41-5]
MSAGGYYPPAGFHFKVEFVGIGNGNDVRFQSVSGLNIEYDTESFKEGGENRFEHKLPVRTKYGDVSLKRGMLINSDVLKWCLNAFENREFRPAKVNVILLNEQHEPLKRWELVDAWPKKWNVSDLNAQENSVVIETLDLSYKYFKVK